MTASSHATTWRKSSRSSGQDTCVEVRHDLNAVRDSKNVTGPAITVDITTLVSAIKAGQLHV